MHEMTQEMLQSAAKAAAGYGHEELMQKGQRISKRYREQVGESRRIKDAGEAAAYAVSRMPATYGAVHFALTEVIPFLSVPLETHLDCGSGTGAAALAVWNLLKVPKLYYQEKESSMRTVGECILRECGPQDIEVVSGTLEQVGLPEADLVTEGYVLGELPADSRSSVLLKMWEAARQVLLLVEPGTPEGFSILTEAKETLKNAGAYVLAPCMSEQCLLDQGDWCHFSVRVPRGQLHKQMKGGNAPYEDEKFCYLALGHNSPDKTEKGRVLRHPQIAPGCIVVRLCTENGIFQKQITKKDPLWKRARKVKWGEIL